MSIALTKTLQTVEYSLHIVTEITYASTVLVAAKMQVHQSAGHYDDGFVPMIQRYDVITDAGTATTVVSNRYTDYAVAINAIEDWLVANVAWYATGVVT